MHYHCCGGGGGDLLDWLLVSFTFASLRFLLSEEIKAELQQEIPCSQVFLVIRWITRLVGRRGLGWDGLESKWFSLLSTTHWHSGSRSICSQWRMGKSYWAEQQVQQAAQFHCSFSIGWGAGFIGLSWFNALSLKTTTEFWWVMIWVALIIQLCTLLVLFSSLICAALLLRWKHERPNLCSTHLPGDGSGWKASKYLSCSFVNEYS